MSNKEWDFEMRDKEGILTVRGEPEIIHTKHEGIQLLSSFNDRFATIEEADQWIKATEKVVGISSPSIFHIFQEKRFKKKWRVMLLKVF